MTFHRYTAYGLGIQSDWILPELVEGSQRADLVIRPGRIDDLPPIASGGLRAFRADPRSARLHYTVGGGLLVREGREIILDPRSNTDEATLRVLLLGPALAVALHQRGRLVLHASAVSIAGGAVLFLGASRSGKSTTAAALYTRGHALIADGLVAVHFEAGRALAAPGFPNQKLSSDSLRALGILPESLPPVAPRSEKRTLRSERGFGLDALRVRRVYVLDDGDTMQALRLPARLAFLELVRSSYLVERIPLLDATGSRSRHFRHCAEFARGVPIVRLRLRRGLGALAHLAAFVEGDVMHPACGGGFGLAGA